MIILITIITFFSTLAGGLFALKFKDRGGLILGFSAGAIIGVSFFDLFPESLALLSRHYSYKIITSVAALGFIIYMILDRLAVLHSQKNSLASLQRGQLGAGSLSVHSLFDGIAIGLLFKVSVSMGIAVAIAVIVHDFSDGINTVTVVLKNKGKKSRQQNG